MTPAPFCEWCNDRGVRDVTLYGGEEGPELDGECACSECCDHPRLELISGPGIACMDCGSWFKSREAAEQSREANRENRP
jgi:hypothetical protein